jgi:hypothetical protein
MRFFRRLQFAFEKIPYISPMHVSLQLPISVAPRRPGSSVIKHMTSGSVLNVTFNYCALLR